MYLSVKNKQSVRTDDLTLREMLNRFLSDNDMPISAISDELGIHRDTLSKFLSGGDLKFMQAVRLMKLLGLSEGEFVSAYSKGMRKDEEYELERLERVSFIAKRFDIPALKAIGIIRRKSKVEDYERQICDFLGLSSIYEYDDTSLMPALFSKSRRRVAEERESKMTEFWLKCAIRTFLRIGNPHDYDRELLLKLIGRTSEFTRDEVNGYYRFVLVLFQLGITVLTQSYTTGTKAHGGVIILDGKPCIVVTDMGKKYHKLWISLLHELYHVVNDYDMLESMKYHYSVPDEPDLLLNEQKADQFALDVLVHPSIQGKLCKAVNFPIRAEALARELGVSPSILYGVYLESLPNGQFKSMEFARFSKDRLLASSDVATRKILFDPTAKKTLDNAINEIRENLYKKII